MKKAPILMPMTAPSGARGRKQTLTGQQTTPRERKPSASTATSPERTRKQSTAPSSGVTDESRRPSSWTSRPSLVGIMAANRMGMGLIRKLRASRDGSKRDSTIGDRNEPPPPTLEPTYRLESKSPFKTSQVEEILKSTLTELLTDRSYRPKIATILCRRMSDDIRDKVKKLNFDRYRCVVNVILGEKKDQGVMASSRCAWDDKRDSYATYTFQAPSFFCTASVYGVYKE